VGQVCLAQSPQPAPPGTRRCQRLQEQLRARPLVTQSRQPSPCSLTCASVSTSTRMMQHEKPWTHSARAKAPPPCLELGKGGSSGAEAFFFFFCERKTTPQQSPLTHPPVCLWRDASPSTPTLSLATLLAACMTAFGCPVTHVQCTRWKYGQ
jgi:hypothetical protein